MQLLIRALRGRNGILGALPRPAAPLDELARPALHGGARACRDPARRGRRPGADRAAARRRPHARDDAPPADRRRAPIRGRGVRLRAAAPPTRAGSSRWCRSPISGTTGRRCCAPARWRPRPTASCQAWTRRVQNFMRDAYGDELLAACASGSRTRRRSRRCTGAACRTRRARRPRCEQVAKQAEAAGYKTHWGRKVLEIRPPVRIDKGAGIVDPAARPRSRGGALRRRRHDGHRRLPRAHRAGGGRAARPRAAGRRALRRGSRPSSRPRPTSWSTARTACGTSCGRCSSEPGGALRRLPQGDRAAERGRRDAPGLDHHPRRHALGGRRGDAGLRRGGLVGGGHRASRSLARAPQRGVAADRTAAGRRSHADDAARAPARADDDQPAVAAAGLHVSGRRSSGLFVPPVAAVASGFAIIWALAWRRQDAAVTAIEDRDGFRFYVDKYPAAASRSGSSARLA